MAQCRRCSFLSVWKRSERLAQTSRQVCGRVDFDDLSAFIEHLYIYVHVRMNERANLRDEEMLPFFPDLIVLQTCEHSL